MLHLGGRSCVNVGRGLKKIPDVVTILRKIVVDKVEKRDGADGLVGHDATLVSNWYPAHDGPAVHPTQGISQGLNKLDAPLQSLNHPSSTISKERL